MLTFVELEKLAQQAFLAGRWQRAETLLLRLVAIREESPLFWFMLGGCRHRLNKLELALDAFERLLLIDPEHRQGRFAAATIACALRRFGRALHHCNSLLSNSPDDPQALTGMGIVLEAQGSTTDALLYYDRALMLDPGWKDALINRGALLLELGEAPAALVNNQQLLAHYPTFHRAHLEVGKASMACGLYGAASESFSQALAIYPNDGATLLHAGFAKALQEDFGVAQILVDCALQVAPELARQYYQAIFSTDWSGKAGFDARSLYLLHHFERIGQCDWAAGDRYLTVFSDLIETGATLKVQALGFRAMVSGISPGLQLRLAKMIADGVATETRPRYANLAPISDKIRIGYLSPNFRNHPTALLTHRVFGLHCRDQFEVYAYAIGPSSDDWLREEIRRGADHFVDLAQLNDDDAARRIAEDGIDILIGLTGYVDYARPEILARRPARIQISSVAYVATTGSDWCDYIVLDTTVAPAGIDDYFTEAIIRMPHSLLPCSYGHLRPMPVGRNRVGLPDSALVLAAFHNGYKIDRCIFSLWMRLLLEHSDACLWLLQGSREMEENLRREARALGVDPERLYFAPRIPHTDHLARLACADLCLDTPVCNGGTTTCDALVARVPVLTCAGPGVVQRTAAGLLKAANFPQGITHSLEEYEARAKAWLGNPAALKRLRADLVQSSGTAPFYRLENWVRPFEAGLFAVWKRYQAGLPPDSITL